MTARYPGFHDFEHAGWEDARVVEGYEREMAAVTRQSALELLGAGAVGPGSRVLDVACGPGFLAAAAAERGASAVGIDFSRAQVATARRLVPEVRFEVADAAQLPFGAASFDAVLCGFGMLHLPDPLAAAREARRVLVSGGWFAYTVWELPERVVAMGAVMRALAAHGAPVVGLPEGPDFFALSVPERSERLLADAGFREVQLASVAQVWRVATPEHVFDVFSRATVRMRALLAAQPPERATAIRAALRDELAPYRSGDVYELPMPALLAAGRAPG